MVTPTLELTTQRGTVMRFYAIMTCDSGHDFIAEPGDTTGINCPQCEENRKAAHEQTATADSLA